MSGSRSARVPQSRPKRPSTLRRDLLFIGVGAVFLWALVDVGIKWDRL